MKGFRFRLEPVLTLRRHREESLQRSLAESQRILDAEVARLQEIDREMAGRVEQLSGHQGPGPLDLDRLSLGSSYLAELERRLDDQGARVDERAGQVARDREVLLQASQDKKALEKLREGSRQAFVRETARAEDKAVEEMATARHVLQRQGQGESD